MNTRKFTGDMADQVEKDRDELIELRAKCERFEREAVMINNRREELRSKLHQCELDATQMREALVHISEYWNGGSEGAALDAANHCQEAAQEVLDSTTAGTAILARLEEARKLFADTWNHSSFGVPGIFPPDEWFDRRDAWLSQK